MEEEEYSRAEGCLEKTLWLYPCLSNDLRLSTESFQLPPPFMMMYDEKKSQSARCKEDVLLIYLHYLSS